MNQEAAPKVFISYSWSSRSHEEWVVGLAHDLTANGVHVVLDKFDLLEGQDAALFMERMVNDTTITKVVLICDRMYKQKADARAGGAGIEAQIVSANLYLNAEKNTKFCAVLSEREVDGSPFLPTYYSSRVYIDLSRESERVERFEQLLRWIFDKPLYERPQLGRPPSFVTNSDNTSSSRTSTYALRCIDALRNARSFAYPSLEDYFDRFYESMEDLRVPFEEPFDEKILQSIEKSKSIIEEFRNLLNDVVRYGEQEEVATRLHVFFERLLNYYVPLEDVMTYRSCDFDNYKYLVYELFVSAVEVCVRQEKFVVLARLVESEYYGKKSRSSDAGMLPFTVFENEHPQIFELLSRKGPTAYISYRAHLLRDRVGESNFRNFMQADLLLALAARCRDLRSFWWPDTLLYSLGGGIFPLFAKCQSTRFYERVRPVIGCEVSKFRDVVHELDGHGGWSLSMFAFPIRVSALCGVDQICTRA